jgi:hypothetical protein
MRTAWALETGSGLAGELFDTWRFRAYVGEGGTIELCVLEPALT